MLFFQPFNTQKSHVIYLYKLKAWNNGDWRKKQPQRSIQMKCIDDNWFRQQLSKICEDSWKHGGEQFERLQRKKSSPNKVLPRVSNEVHTCIDDNQFRQQLSWNLSITPYATHYISTNTLENSWQSDLFRICNNNLCLTLHSPHGKLYQSIT